jgi:hypothetical protein
VTSKGLLSLGVGGISALADPGCMEKLVGDFIYLRLNELNWPKNSDFVEKSVNLLADNLLSRSVKKTDFTGSLG